MSLKLAKKDPPNLSRPPAEHGTPSCTPEERRRELLEMQILTDGDGLRTDNSHYMVHGENVGQTYHCLQQFIRSGLKGPCAV